MNRSKPLEKLLSFRTVYFYIFIKLCNLHPIKMPKKACFFLPVLFIPGRIAPDLGALWFMHFFVRLDLQIGQKQDKTCQC